MSSAPVSQLSALVPEASMEPKSDSSLETGSSEVDHQLYSRQLYAIGKEAMTKLSSASVLILGLNGLGLEVAKCVTLTGVGQVTLWDDQMVTRDDLTDNYFLDESHLGQNRAEVVKSSLAELNQYVKVRTSQALLKDLDYSSYTVVVSCDLPLRTQMLVNQWAYEAKTCFLSGQCRGLFAQIFADFGDEFTVSDHNGERIATGVIEAITQDEQGVVMMAPNTPHKLEVGDLVQFSGIEGMEELNGQTKRVTKVINTHQFCIDDTRELTPYTNRGEMTQVKESKSFKFERMGDSLEAMPMIVDLAHMERPPQLLLAFRALDQFEFTQHRAPRPWNHEDAELMLKMARELAGENEDLVSEEMVMLLSKTAQGRLAPMMAVFGGFLGQEVMKACSHKYTPLSQWLLYEETSCLSEDGREPEDWEDDSRYAAQVRIFGREFQEKLMAQRVFLVGAGAIGCEHLKNFALMGLGCEKGEVIVTDMDNIEVSNLNRQFLFRSRDVGKSKSLCAVEAVTRMNPSFRGTPQENKIGPDNEKIYPMEFWQSLDLVAGALDNLNTRLYIDETCVANRKPLLESGTLGTKGNTQCIIPDLTESYGSSRDPPEESIPVCTLRNFPNVPEHAVEWARDEFAGLFEQGPLHLQNYLTDPDFISKLDSNEQIQVVLNLKRMLGENLPRNYEDCVRLAVKRFLMQNRDQIGNLLHKFPQDHKTAEGALFWSGSKRCPSMLELDLTSETQREYLFHTAQLWAQVFSLEASEDSSVLDKVVAEMTLPEFKVDEKAKFSADEKEEEKAQEEATEEFNLEKELEALPKPTELADLKVTPLEFEKDDDTNHHIAFITATANLRSQNYGLKQLGFQEVKGIAGKIIPALITTTTMVSGLVMMELYKVVQGHQKIESYSNSFLNLANPQFVQSDPLDAPSFDYGAMKGINMWSQLVLDHDYTLGEFKEELDEKYEMDLEMLTQGGKILFAFDASEERLAMRLSEIVAEIQKEPVMEKTLVYNFAAGADEELGEGQTLPTLVVPVHQVEETASSTDSAPVALA